MKKILIITNCRLGDSLVMIPALHAIREYYGQAFIALASESQAKGIAAAQDVLGNRGLVDSFENMPFSGNWFKRLLSRLGFFVKMRKTKWDTGIVLMPPCPL